MLVQFLCRDLFNRVSVLMHVFVGMGSQKILWPVGIGSVVTKGIEFMIPHHRQCASVVNHRSDQLEHFPDLRPAVDEISHKDSFPRWMGVVPLGPAVAEQFQERSQFGSVAVNVTDKVIHGFGYPWFTSSGRPRSQ